MDASVTVGARRLRSSTSCGCSRAGIRCRATSPSNPPCTRSPSPTCSRFRPPATTARASLAGGMSTASRCPRSSIGGRAFSRSRATARPAVCPGGTVCWAYRYELEGRTKIAVRSRIWSNRRDVPHHQYVAGSELRLGLLEDFIAEGLGRRYDVREVVFDPQMFLGEAQRLADRGFQVAPVHQATTHMVEAVQGFYRACREQSLSHAGE